MDLNLKNIDKELFEYIPSDNKDLNTVVRPSETYWQDAWRRLKENKVATFSLFALILLILISIIGPYLSKFDYRTNDINSLNLSPNSEHWFGTDELGRDLYVRVLYGMRISLSVGIVSALINFVIGVIYGGISGYYGGNIDNIMMRFVDVLYSVPTVLYVILLMVVLGEASLSNIFIALGISYWVGMARIVRGQVLALKQQEFVLAARALGAKNFRIILRHLIPNSMGPIIVTLMMSIPSAIFTEAFLSFIGLGVSAPMASLGVLCNDAITTYRTYPYQLFFPSLAICIIMLAFNLFGDGLRDALDPKMRK
ncbi:oligopeptide transport system permease protein [Caloramator quimbayensis]|uniref:Oligopeptide transport system permease protein n=1 Tax=Caloramator quimbayensis TaxID=1147123 RepID=A0A1T4XLN1_9CLOT|nr:ABC transporter permease [Caloramator quimbayensis]SKA89981.1 oligopeptide transport system permease protein [Caloramator quimbayensis]